MLDVSDLNLWQDDGYWPIFSQLRDKAPVYHCEDSAYGPYWSVTKYQDILTVETNHEVFSSASEHGGVIIHDDVAVKFADRVLEGIITMDPPRHSQQRSAVSGVVARPNLPNFEPIIRERTTSLLDTLPVGEIFDWVESVSVELTTQMLATLFDFPFEDRHKLTRWSNVATSEPGQGVTANESERIREVKDCLFTFTKLWRERRDNASGFDFVSMLSQNPNTRDMKPMNFLGNILVLIVGGNDTTRNSMSGAIAAFDQYPGELDKLKANPSLMDNAISEIIRWQTPIAHMRRTATAPFILNGQEIAPGEKIVMWYASGNKDEDIFEDAETFQIDRENASRHLSFGFGIHRCMGRRLSELQLKILLEEILKRWDRIEIAGPPVKTRSNFVHGFDALPVRIIA
ncbi:MAG: cytochrome P450 [Marinicaulis sp.]|nr:cytochrome P450 [Marinicaulis sp.]